MSQKIEITVPTELSWMIEFYEKKAETRAMLPGATADLSFEFLVALEQYAIQGLKCKSEMAKSREIAADCNDLPLPIEKSESPHD